MKRLALLAVLAACGSSGSTNSGDPMVTASVTPTTAAPGDTVQVTVTTQNFTLVDFTQNPTPTAGEGHFHVYIDTKPDYLVASFISPADVRIPTDTPAGAHSLKVVLANNDHSELSPEVSATLPITIAAP